MPLVYATDQSKLEAQQSVKRLVWGALDRNAPTDMDDAGTSFRPFEQKCRALAHAWRTGTTEAEPEEKDLSPRTPHVQEEGGAQSTSSSSSSSGSPLRIPRTTILPMPLARKLCLMLHSGRRAARVETKSISCRDATAPCHHVRWASHPSITASALTRSVS